MDFTGFSFTPQDTLALFIGCWVLGLTVGTIASLLGDAVRR